MSVLSQEQLHQERLQLDREWEKLRAAQEKFNQERIDSGVEYKLFVGNVDENSTEAEMRAIFEPYGDLKEVIMLRSKDGKSKRSCFIKYFSKADSEAAIAGVNTKIHDKDQPQALVVRYAKDVQAPPAPGRVPSYGAGFGAPAPSYGGGFSNAGQQGWNGNPTGGGYGGFGGGGPGYTPGGYPGGGIRPPPQLPNSRGSSPGPAGGVPVTRGPAGANLYVNNLAPQATDHDLRAMFSDFGNVVSVKVFTGYGFVSFDTSESAQAAIQCLNGLTNMGGGRPLEVRLKSEKSQNRFNPY